jgi:hypothetical protein
MGHKERYHDGQLDLVIVRMNDSEERVVSLENTNAKLKRG